MWTQELLTQKTLDLDIISSSWNTIIPGEDSYEIVLMLKNKAGHKFPSGYPSRRAFIEFLITNLQGDTIFHSGKRDPSGSNIINSDEFGLLNFEPHYDIINSEEQVQIYEVVDGDVSGSPTNIQERAAIKLKDNRLVPYGFSVNHSAYDTTSIVGEALYDPNFNSNGSFTGTGTDNIIYSIPSEYFGSETNFNLMVNIWYQSMPPKWVNSMFDYESPEIELFQGLFEEHGSEPVLIASKNSVINLTDGLEEVENLNSINIFPNPTINGLSTLNWNSLGDQSVFEIYNSSGSRVNAGTLVGHSGSLELELPKASGMYLVKIHHNGGVLTKRVARK